jgi:replicative DNA helicase
MYLPERDVLLLLLKKEYYNSFFSSLDLQYIKDNYKELHYVYLVLIALHEEYPDQDLDIAALQAYFFVRHPDADKETYLNLFKTLSETTLDAAIGVGILKQIKRRKQALKLSEEAFKYSTGHSSIDEVLQLSSELEGNNPSDVDEIEVVSDDLEQILNDTVKQPGLRWRLDCLNKSLGSLRTGNFGFIFSRPETGKTTFLASETTNMLDQLPEGSGPIIWFNNEQVGSEVMLRIYQGFFGVSLEQLLSNPKKYHQMWQAKCSGRFKLIDDANISKAKVDHVCKQLRPSLVIFDQIDKIKGFASDREDLRLGTIYIWARELAKQYCPVIGVCQADGTAENQKWLGMEHVSNAKTSKQAEADWILGIGAVHSEGTENIRYLNISKNKLLGDVDTMPDLRHGRFETYIEKTVARYKDIVNYD